MGGGEGGTREMWNEQGGRKRERKDIGQMDMQSEATEHI